MAESAMSSGPLGCRADADVREVPVGVIERYRARTLAPAL